MLHDNTWFVQAVPQAVCAAVGAEPCWAGAPAHTACLVLKLLLWPGSLVRLQVS